jgi:hypothetical protein
MTHPYAHHRAENRAKAHKMVDRAGYKRGGAVHDDAAADAKMIRRGVHEHERHMHKGEAETPILEGAESRKHLAKRARGGHVGKKGHSTKVNVIVAPQGGGGMHPPMPMPMPPPNAAPVGAGAPAMPPPRPPMGGAGMMPTGPAPMMRKRGGHIPHMEAGAMSGPGRIEKMHEYGKGGFKPKKVKLHA